MNLLTQLNWIKVFSVTMHLFDCVKKIQINNNLYKLSIKKEMHSKKLRFLDCGNNDYIHGKIYFLSIKTGDMMIFKVKIIRFFLISQTCCIYIKIIWSDIHFTFI